MESHSSEKIGGEGMLLGATTDASQRCRRIDALGRRCRMLVASPEIGSSDALDALQGQAAGLCSHHAQQLLRRRRATEATAAELLASVGDFSDAASVNRFLGNLLKLAAVKRVPRKDAVALAYISQLILNSQAAQDRRELMRLQIAELDAQRQKNLPTRVIWDLPLRQKPPDRERDQEEDREANAGKAGPSETSQASPTAPAPPAPVSSQGDTHETAQLPAQAPPPPPDGPALKEPAPAQPMCVTSPSASKAGLPGAAQGPRNPLADFKLTGGHTTDWYAPASWSKPNSPPGAYSTRRWHGRSLRYCR